MSRFADLFVDRRPVLAHLRVDCTVSERHTEGVRRTQYPIEDGADLDDHIEDLPGRLDLEGVISDVPPPIALATGEAFRVGTDEFLSERSKSAHEQMLELLRSHEPFTVVTSLATYVDYYFGDGDSYVVERDFERSEELSFTATLSPFRTAFTGFSEAQVDPDLEDVLGNPATSGSARASNATGQELTEALLAL